MSVSKQWPGGGTNTSPASYSIPESGELNWQALSSFLQALGDSAQATTFQKWAILKATTTPVAVSATSDCVVACQLGVAGAVTVNLPAGATKQTFIIYDSTGDAATNNITINRNGTDTIRGATSLTINQNYGAVVLTYNAGDTDWKVLGPVAPLDSDLIAIGNLSTNGLIARTGSGTAATRTITAASSKVAVTNGDGVSGNPTVDVTESNLTLDNIGGTLGVAKGGTGLTGGTSGGVPYYSGAAAITSSGVLASNGVVLGGGAGASPTTTAAGAANQVLRVPGGGGAPAFGAVDLAQASAVTGTLPVGNGGTGITSLGTGVATFLGTPSSANLAAALTDETGSGAAVFATSPTLSAPTVDDGLVLEQIATPANPSAGYNKIYPKTDGLLYKLDSAGNEVLVGSGSGAGEINIVVNPDGDTALDGGRTNDVGDWIDSGTGTTSTRTTTSAEIPLYPTKTNAIKIANDGSSTGYTYLRMTLPPALYNRKLKLSWEQIVSTSTAYVSGDYTIELYSNAASNYGGAYTAIPFAGGTTLSLAAADGKFQTSFDTTTAPYLEMRVVRAAGAAGSYIALNAVTVGPGIQPQGAVVEEWQSFTPSWTNISVGSGTVQGRYRRVGDSVEIESALSFAADTSVTGTIQAVLPTGLTAIAPASITRVIGTVAGNDSPTAYEGSVLQNTSNVISFRFNATTSDANATVPFTWGTGDILRYRFTVPIAEWSGSGTVNVAQNDVEYASNSGTNTAADDTTNFAYGPSGSQFISYTAEHYKDVQFQAPISGKIPNLQVSADSGTTWISVSQDASIVPSFDVQNTASYGMRMTVLSANKVRVYFGQYRRNFSATYGGAGTAWSTISGSSQYLWRVSLASPGQAVGFGIADTNSSGLVPSGTYARSTGAWTLGPSSGASQAHLIQGGNVVQGVRFNLLSNHATSGNTEFRMGRPSDHFFKIFTDGNGNGGGDVALVAVKGTGSLNFYTGGEAAGNLNGAVSSTGAWTLGPSGFTGTHTVRGNVANSTGGATHSSNIGTLSTSAVWYKANITVATVALQGISGGIDGRSITITNTGTQVGDIRNEDAGASASDRIITGTGGNLSSWLTGGSVKLIYDGAVSRWRVVAAYRAS